MSKLQRPVHELCVFSLGIVPVPPASTRSLCVLFVDIQLTNTEFLKSAQICQSLRPNSYMGVACRWCRDPSRWPSSRRSPASIRRLNWRTFLRRRPRHSEPEMYRTARTAPSCRALRGPRLSRTSKSITTRSHYPWGRMTTPVCEGAA